MASSTGASDDDFDWNGFEAIIRETDLSAGAPRQQSTNMTTDQVPIAQVPPPTPNTPAPATPRMWQQQSFAPIAANNMNAFPSPYLQNVRNGQMNANQPVPSPMMTPNAMMQPQGVHGHYNIDSGQQWAGTPMPSSVSPSPQVTLFPPRGSPDRLSPLQGMGGQSPFMGYVGNNTSPVTMTPTALAKMQNPHGSSALQHPIQLGLASHANAQMQQAMLSNLHQGSMTQPLSQAETSALLVQQRNFHASRPRPSSAARAPALQYPMTPNSSPSYFDSSPAQQQNINTATMTAKKRSSDDMSTAPTAKRVKTTNHSTVDPRTPSPHNGHHPTMQPSINTPQSIPAQPVQAMRSNINPQMMMNGQSPAMVNAASRVTTTSPQVGRWPMPHGQDKVPSPRIPTLASQESQMQKAQALLSALPEQIMHGILNEQTQRSPARRTPSTTNSTCKQQKQPLQDGAHVKNGPPVTPQDRPAAPLGAQSQLPNNVSKTVVCKNPLQKPNGRQTAISTPAQPQQTTRDVGQQPKPVMCPGILTESQDHGPRYPPPTVPAPSKGQQSGLFELRMSTMLKAYLETEKRKEEAQAQAAKASKPQLAPAPPMVEGPVTQEENAKALLETVKERMKTLGPSYGTNPDLTVAAEPRQLMKVRLRLSEELRRRIALQMGAARYLPATRVMESAK